MRFSGDWVSGTVLITSTERGRPVRGVRGWLLKRLTPATHAVVARRDLGVVRALSARLALRYHRKHAFRELHQELMRLTQPKEEA